MPIKPRVVFIILETLLVIGLFILLVFGFSVYYLLGFIMLYLIITLIWPPIDKRDVQVNPNSPDEVNILPSNNDYTYWDPNANIYLTFTYQIIISVVLSFLLAQCLFKLKRNDAGILEGYTADDNFVVAFGISLAFSYFFIYKIEQKFWPSLFITIVLNFLYFVFDLSFDYIFNLIKLFFGLGFFMILFSCCFIHGLKKGSRSRRFIDFISSCTRFYTLGLAYLLIVPSIVDRSFFIVNSTTFDTVLYTNGLVYLWTYFIAMALYLYHRWRLDRSNDLPDSVNL
jgi:hypothetical protein